MIHMHLLPFSVYFNRYYKQQGRKGKKGRKEGGKKGRRGKIVSYIKEP